MEQDKGDIIVWVYGVQSNRQEGRRASGVSVIGTTSNYSFKLVYRRAVSLLMQKERSLVFCCSS